MTPARHTNPELAALETQWWKDWWAADYSWDGLARHMTAPGSDAHHESLQTFWAGEEPHLIAEPGTARRWTRLHCPLIFADGSPSPKAGWTEGQWQELHAVIARQRIHLSGAVLDTLDIPIAPTGEDRPRIDAQRIYVRHDTALNSPAEITFENAWFAGAVTSNSDLVIDFRDAVFHGPARFDGAQLSTLEAPAFAGARFIAPAHFRRTVFRQSAGHFVAAKFSAAADFSEAVFHSHGDFTGTQFAGTTDFFGVQFIGRALLDEARCLDDISFYKAAFIRRLSLNGATFYGRINLEGITDSDPIAQTPQAIELRATERDGISGLTGTLDPGQGPSHASFQSIPKLLARRATFHEDANFSNRDLLSPSTFERSRFHHRARFHGSDIHANVNLHATRFRDALSYRPGNPPKYPDELLKLRYLTEPTAAFPAWKKGYVRARIDHRKADYDHDSYFDGLEASFRTLKQMMEDRRDRVREGEFFNLELRARRRRSDVPWWERIASFFYWLISDYGNSIIRPLAMLIVLFVASAFTYYALGEAGPFSAWHEPDHLLSAFGFSLRNVFAPFSLFGADNFNESDIWSQAVVLTADPGFSLLIRAIASAQSLLSLLLVFLAGLAGRRRFQIN